ncbi:MAG: tetratricopeptide repeat protein [Gammaproteobacteria bacterium]
MPQDTRQVIAMMQTAEWAEAQRLQAAGDYPKAAEIYRRLLIQAPRSAALWFNLAACRHLMGDLSGAERDYREALAIDPGLLEGYLNLGTLLQATGRAAEAEALYREGMRYHAAEARLWNNLGNAQYALGRFEAAIQTYDEVLRREPDYAEAWNNRGVALKALDRLDEAAQSFLNALRCRSDYAEAWCNLGNTRKRGGDYAGAIECYEHGLRLQPRDPQTYSNLANALQQLGHTAEALEFYEVALKLAPDLAVAQWNRGLVRLQLGEFEAGWRDYEAGFAVGERPRRHFPMPRWEGEPLEGRRLLVHTEQGFGDTLHFVRYLPELKARGATVILECQPAMERLLAHSGLADRVVVRDAGDEVNADFYLPLLSLPGMLGTTLETIPAQPAYLKAAAEWGTPWRGQLAGLQGLRVGICWSGNPTARNNPERSCPLGALAPLAREGVALVSLQLGAAAEELPPQGMSLRHLDPEPADFADTASIVAGLDLVVTVDTAVAHLAGAMGRPTWLMLSHVADWRWLVDRHDSPWYPSMRLFRQPQRGDWQAVVDAMGRALQEKLAA